MKKERLSKKFKAMSMLDSDVMSILNKEKEQLTREMMIDS